MIKDNTMENNKIGAAILYFRESYHISQSRLCKGLCSVATLSRIEAGERDVDSLLLETLLERLGKTPNQFELILTDLDYMLYQSREDIIKELQNKNAAKAYELLSQYEERAESKSNVHMQFIISCRALLNELNGGTAKTTIDLLMEAIAYTVPDFKTYRIKDYFLSNRELNIIIEVVQKMISNGMNLQAKEILEQVLDYLDSHVAMEKRNKLYPKVAYIAASIYMQEQNMAKALEMSNKGLERNKGNQEMDYIGELNLVKARSREGLLKKQEIWVEYKKECLKLYLQAYYTLEFYGELEAADQIRKHLQEEYEWEGID